MKQTYEKSILLLLLLLLTVLAGCGRQTDSQADQEEEQEDRIQIGISFDSFILERWQRDRDVFVAAAQELGAEVNVQNANGDMEEQIAQVDYFIQKRMDVIVLVMVASGKDESRLTEAVERAQKAGIPVVAYDRLILNADVDLYISFDNGQVGRLMAEHMQEHLEGEGELLQVCGPLADYNVSQVMDGFSEVLAGSELRIVKTEYAEGWLGETGFAAAADYLQRYDQVDGIMCGNDSIAGNAIRAPSGWRGVCGRTGCRPGSLSAHCGRNAVHDRIQTGGETGPSGGGAVSRAGWRKPDCRWRFRESVGSFRERNGCSGYCYSGYHL